jgi:hypothetical protein
MTLILWFTIIVKIPIWYGVQSCKYDCEALVAMCDLEVILLKMMESSQNMLGMFEC